MKYTHVILIDGNTANLDKSIRISGKMYSIDRIEVVAPKNRRSLFTEKIKEIKQKWKDVELKDASTEGFDLCALDICDRINEIVSNQNWKDKEIVINIAYANPIFTTAGLFCASILKTKIISIADDEPEDIFPVPYDELISIRYAILKNIPETKVGTQELLMKAVNDEIEDGSYPELGLKALSPTNLSHHLKYLDNAEYIVRVSTGRKKEIIITNLGRLMKISYEILKVKEQK